MIDHVLAVGACWLVALCGLAMFVRAKGFRGKVAGHTAVITALASLSAMALDHKHPESQAVIHSAGDFVSPATDRLVHADQDCKRLKQLMHFTSIQQAALWNRKPCPECSTDHAEDSPDEGHEHDGHPDTSE